MGNDLERAVQDFQPNIDSELWKYQYNYSIHLTQKGEREHLLSHKRCETVSKDAIFTKLVLQTTKLRKEDKNAVINYQRSNWRPHTVERQKYTHS